MFARIATIEDMYQVYKLTHDMYVVEGYIKPQPSGILQHYKHLDYIPETTVLVIDDNGNIIGTNSLTFDGPNKLHVDEDFPEEVEKVRQECKITGKNLVASWRIITHLQTRNSLHIIIELINATMEIGIKNHAHVWLFSFNPKHERIYKRLLDLTTIATINNYTTVSAPGVLMRGESEKMIYKWKIFCKKRNIVENLDVRNIQL